jgi:hypothetical protein
MMFAQRFAGFFKVRDRKTSSVIGLMPYTLRR